MTREEAIQFLDNIKHEEAGRAIGKDGFYVELMGYHVEALNMAIKALEQEPTDDATLKDIFCMGCEYKEQEPCTDAVSRDAVKELIKCGVSTDTYDDVEQVCKWIDALPSVRPQKSGKWINDECGNVICSECKRFRRDCRYGHTNYCNHCGARMESEDK